MGGADSQEPEGFEPGEQWRDDFEQAMSKPFGEFVSPPVPFEDASPHECCEVVRSVAGHDVTPASLAALNKAQLDTLAWKFGQRFGCDPPTVEQVKDAVAHTLARWPVGSLGESA